MAPLRILIFALALKLGSTGFSAAQEGIQPNELDMESFRANLISTDKVGDPLLRPYLSARTMAVRRNGYATLYRVIRESSPAKAQQLSQHIVDGLEDSSPEIRSQVQTWLLQLDEQAFSDVSRQKLASSLQKRPLDRKSILLAGLASRSLKKG